MSKPASPEILDASTPEMLDEARAIVRELEMDPDSLESVLTAVHFLDFVVGETDDEHQGAVSAAKRAYSLLDYLGDSGSLTGTAAAVVSAFLAEERCECGGPLG